MLLEGRELVLAVTGSVAAYKAAYLLRELRRLGATVAVVMTEHAREFVAPLTFRTLSGRPVLSNLFDPQEPTAVEHIDLAERTDLVMVAPATANALTRAALGLADDFLGTLLLATRAPILFAPAMDGEMWRHAAVQGHVATLRARGATVMEPEQGELASGLIGPGRFPHVDDIVETVARLVWPKRDLTADHVLVTAGPTREPIDPVRYLSNRSSGRMGYAVATLAARRGAQVTLVTGPTSLRPPIGVRVIPVQTAEEMREAVLQAVVASTIVIKAAAVGDYRVAYPASGKIRSKHDGLTMTFVPSPDILQELGRTKAGRFLVGFAAETADVHASALAKLETKGVDLMIANDVSRTDIGFDAEDNEVVMLDRWGGVVELQRLPKLAVADAILDRVQTLRRATLAARTP
ncbi:MAG: bifunctional phosphopantothenoylcysteine decarboxylase/phosphopantothenate--cysteine ligase CoaBC [Candidatus Rokuibacteriota bacterium]